MCKKRLNVFCLSLSFAVLLFCSAATSAWPQDASVPTPSLQSTPPQSPLPMPSLPDFDEILTELGAEALALSEESKLLLLMLEASRTEARGLSLSLTRSESRLTAFEASREVERGAARKELEAALRDAQAARGGVRLWRGATIIAGCVAAALGAVAVMR